MDYQTVNASDMHTCDLLRGDAEKRGQTVTFTHDPAQKWYYLDQQRTDEVTVIKIWDNSSDPGISKCTRNPAVSMGTFTDVLQFVLTRPSTIQMRPRTWSRGKVWKLDV